MTTIFDFVETLNKGSFTTVSLVNEPKMNKKNNPYIGRVTCKTTYKNCRLGCSYEKSIDASLGRNNIEGKFETEKPFGMHFINDFILQSDKDENQYYLRVQMYADTKTDKIYYLDGQELTDTDILAEIKSFMPKPSTSAKQANMGLTEEQQVIVRSIKLENITGIKQGEKIWNK